MIHESKCRICLRSDLETYLDLGNLALSGFFPLPDENVPTMPLTLAKCRSCGLSQLLHQLPVSDLYGSHYGYESHLNSGMKAHLVSMARKVEGMVELEPGDTVVDIASNDGTLLAGYSRYDINKVGIDPLIEFLMDCYPQNSIKIPTFFSAESYEKFSNSKAKIVTSFSVFYDLDNPSKFAEDVSRILDPEGIWVLEQSYFWSMIDTLSFDTVCHEHLLYLRLMDLERICSQTGLAIFDIEFNSVNGGSVQIYTQKQSGRRTRSPFVDWQLRVESRWEELWEFLSSKFARDVHAFRDSFGDLLDSYRSNGFSIFGLGASTKGNILLQACRLGPETIKVIGEINPNKFGRETPGTKIPIRSQQEVLSNVDEKSILVILPWHFSETIIRANKSLLPHGARFLSPLPRTVSVISP